MSTAEHADLNTQRAERPVLLREFRTADLDVQGRTVDVRLVPFNEVATVADPPDWQPYREQWLPGVFDHQLNAASRVHAKYGHSESVLDVVGHGIELRSVDADGYHISTKIHQTPQGDTLLELLHDDALPCVSLEANPIRTLKSSAGVVQRVKANLRGFAFCRQGAFAGARVLAIREEEVEEETMFSSDLLPVDAASETIERCERLGITVPDRLREVIRRAFTETPWDGSESRWPTAAAYCAASAIDLNQTGKPKTKALCHLPYKEPGSGAVNVNAVRNALSRIGQGDPQDATQAERDTAQAMLERLLAQFNNQ